MSFPQEEDDSEGGFEYENEDYFGMHNAAAFGGRISGRTLAHCGSLCSGRYRGA